jgi:hypothetical protein
MEYTSMIEMKRKFRLAQSLMHRARKLTISKNKTVLLCTPGRIRSIFTGLFIRKGSQQKRPGSA